MREAGTPFVVLPGLRYGRVLEHDAVLNWCRTLNLPVEDFIPLN
jgi:hypothetical protein